MGFKKAVRVFDLHRDPAQLKDLGRERPDLRRRAEELLGSSAHTPAP